MAVWKSLVICGESPVSTSTTTPLTDPTHMCTFTDLVILTNNVIQDLIVVATVLTTAVFLWTGLKLVTATFQGNTGAMNDAKRVFKNVLIGYIVILSAWVVVYTILHALVDPRYWLLG